MMSILSGGANHLRNTISLRIGGGPHALTHSDGQTNTVLVDEGTENSNIEEMHYLMVQVEKLKKTMLYKIEGTKKVTGGIGSGLEPELEEERKD